MIMALINWPAFLMVVMTAPLLVTAYPTGPPRNVCNGLVIVPAHGVGQQTSPSPYMIVVNDTTWKSDQFITVSIVSSESFRGFILVARNENGSLFGSFRNESFEPGVKLQSCNSDGTYDMVGHSNGETKVNLTFTWEDPRPSDPSNKLPKFVAAVVQSKEVFWVEIMSNDMESTTGSPSNTTVMASENMSTGDMTSTGAEHANNTTMKTSTTAAPANATLTTVAPTNAALTTVAPTNARSTTVASSRQTSVGSANTTDSATARGATTTTAPSTTRTTVSTTSKDDTAEQKISGASPLYLSIVLLLSCVMAQIVR